MFCLTLKGFYTFKILVRIMIFDKQTSFLSSFRSELAKVRCSYSGLYWGPGYRDAFSSRSVFRLLPFQIDLFWTAHSNVCVFMISSENRRRKRIRVTGVLGWGLSVKRGYHPQNWVKIRFAWFRCKSIVKSLMIIQNKMFACSCD